MAMGRLGEGPVVARRGVPEPDKATLNPIGLIGDILVAVTPVAATGRLLTSLIRGTCSEDVEGE
jgi:hypothetical protein